MAIEKVLVIDDEPIIRKSFEELLRGKRYGVTAVATLRSAEKLLKRDPFDLIFLDRAVLIPQRHRASAANQDNGCRFIKNGLQSLP